MTDSYVYRAISRKDAEWIGNAAAVAGGYVAIDGPRINRISAKTYAERRDEIERGYASGLNEDYVREEEADLSRYRHVLQGGDRAAVSQSGDYVLRVPTNGPLSHMGYSIPASLIEELTPALQAAGYDV